MSVMYETAGLLTAENAREALHTYVDHVDTQGFDSFAEYEHLVGTEGLRVPLALASLVFHNGQPYPHRPSEIAFHGRNNGWNLTASSRRDADYESIGLERQHRRFYVGPRERSVFVVMQGNVAKGFALKETPLSSEHHTLDGHNDSRALAGFLRISHVLIRDFLAVTEE